jgi:hypothetical protein
MTLTEATEKPATKPLLLEVWGRNEVMRHVPTLDWIVQKLDRDLRARIHTLYAPVASLAADDPRRATIEDLLRSVCRAVDRLGDTARHSRAGNPPNDLGDRLEWSIGHAVSCLNTLDANLFGRRCPFHSFDRSKSEAIYGALLAVISAVHRLATLVRTIDPDVDLRLLDGLVKLEAPLREEPMA